VLVNLINVVKHLDLFAFVGVFARFEYPHFLVDGLCILFEFVPLVFQGVIAANVVGQRQEAVFEFQIILYVLRVEIFVQSLLLTEFTIVLEVAEQCVILFEVGWLRNFLLEVFLYFFEVRLSRILFNLFYDVLLFFFLILHQIISVFG
jgi:hypothetical protein